MRARSRIILAAALAAAAALLARLPPAACPCEDRASLPAGLDGLRGAPAEEAEGIAERLKPDRLEVIRYGRDHEALTAVLVHHHALRAENHLYAHAIEVCHELAGWRPLENAAVELPGGLRARRFLLGKDGAQRLVHAAYLGPVPGPAEPGLFRAWLGALGRGLLHRPTGGSLLILSTASRTGLGTGDAARQDRRMAQLLISLGAGPRTPPDR